MLKKINCLFLIATLAPTILVFKAFFLPGPLAWGDAPYFFPEHIRSFVGEPNIWVSWGKIFGGISDVLWIHPIMFLWGVLSQVFNIESGGAVRLLFYFPAVLLSIISPILLTRYLGYSKITQFFTSFFYTLNTYFLLLIDGGQVGVALSYSLFPLSLLSLLRLSEKPTLVNFYQTVLVFMLLVSTDLRIAIICFLTFLIWPGAKPLGTLFLFGISLLGLNMYWLLPTTSLLPTGGTLSVSQPELSSLLNSLFLFQPHWYLNEFGKVTPPHFYFAGIPLLVFGSLFSGKRKNFVFAFCFLVFAFLAKGNAPPLGFVYSWFTDNVPFGFAFRDSSKFFIPLVLIGGILMGRTIHELYTRFGKVVIIFSYLYLLILASPALSGKMQGVLSGRQVKSDVNKVNQVVKSSEGFLRVAWFPEQSVWAYYTERKQALHAKNLINARPFAALNVGNQVFNFLHKQEFVDWFGLLGIKYLVFPGDQRKITWNDEEKHDWDNLLELIATTPGLSKEDWGTSFPVYSIPGAKPNIFTTDKLFAVVGSDDIYARLKNVEKEFSVGNQAFVFFEDGKFEPRNLAGAAPQSVVLVFNQKNDNDLTMSFLQKYFIRPKENVSNEWAMRAPGEYLKWKYELLTKGVEVEEFDYGKGIAFSTEKGESISFNFDVPSEDEYIFATRTLEAGKFKWKLENGDFLKKGKFKKEFINTGGIHVINTLALIPKKDWEEARRLTEDLISTFEVVKLGGTDDSSELKGLAGSSLWQGVSYEAISPVRYKVKALEKGHWIVFTDSYHPKWQLKKGVEYVASYPFYSMVNGFYIGPLRTGQVEIVFRGQEYVRWGIYISAVTLVLIIIIFLWFYRSSRYNK